MFEGSDSELWATRLNDFRGIPLEFEPIIVIFGESIKPARFYDKAAFKNSHGSVPLGT